MKNFIPINFIYIRDKNYLNRKEFSLKHGVSYGALSSYEQGVSLPPVDFIQRICSEYKVSIDDFVNKDLSKEKKQVNKQLNEDREAYKIPDKSVELYNKIIDAKESQIESLNLRIEELKKQINIYEVLLNQNGIL